MQMFYFGAVQIEVLIKVGPPCAFQSFSQDFIGPNGSIGSKNPGSGQRCGLIIDDIPV